MNEALQFADELRRLYARERTAMADFMIALVEFDRRRLYLELGYNSLWKFCLEGLLLGEGATNLRTRVVGLLQRFPALIDPLRDGRLTLSSLCEIGKVLTEQNVTELIDRAAWKTHEEAEVIVASLRPKEVRSEGLFRAPDSTAASVPQSNPTTCGGPDDSPHVTPPTIPVSSPPAPPRPFEPVSGSEWRFRALLSQDTKERLLTARELAASTVGTEWDDLLRAMADAYIEKVEKRLAKKSDRPRKSNRMPKADGTISAAVRQVVWARDEGRCSWIGPDGHRCGERRHLNYDHIIPRAQGGPSTPENIRLLCSAHNQHHADNIFGRAFMETKRRQTAHDVVGDSREKQAPEERQAQLDFT